jgi:gluconolactonase
VNNRRIHTYTPGGTVGVFFEPTNWTNGMFFEPDGNLLMAEMGGGMGGRITRMHRDQTIEVLIDHDPMGNKLQTTDDLVVRWSDGTIYFTDPIITHGPYYNDLGSLATHPYYRLKAGMPPREIAKEGQASLPNGVRLTPDEKTLLIAAYYNSKILRFAVAEDGSLTPGEDFATGLSKPDSMCLDAAGNVYVGVTQGLQILSSDGKKVKLLPISSPDGTTNCGFGGPDGKTLWVTAWTLFMQLDNTPIPGNDWLRNKQIKCD